MSKCDNCGSTLKPISPAQSEYVSGKTFKLPFTDICLTIYHDKPTIEYGCNDCLIDHSQERFRDAFDAGVDYAMDKVYDGDWTL